MDIDTREKLRIKSGPRLTALPVTDVIIIPIRRPVNPQNALTRSGVEICHLVRAWLCNLRPAQPPQSAAISSAKPVESAAHDVGRIAVLHAVAAVRVGQPERMPHLMLAWAEISGKKRHAKVRTIWISKQGTTRSRRSERAIPRCVGIDTARIERDVISASPGLRIRKLNPGSPVAATTPRDGDCQCVAVKPRLTVARPAIECVQRVNIRPKNGLPPLLHPYWIRCVRCPSNHEQHGSLRPERGSLHPGHQQRRTDRQGKQQDTKRPLDLHSGCINHGVLCTTHPETHGTAASFNFSIAAFAASILARSVMMAAWYSVRTGLTNSRITERQSAAAVG